MYLSLALLAEERRQEVPGLGLVLSHFPSLVPFHTERMLMSQLYLEIGLGRQQV